MWENLEAIREQVGSISNGRKKVQNKERGSYEENRAKEEGCIVSWASAKTSSRESM